MQTINIKTEQKRCHARAEFWEKGGKFYLRCWNGKRRTPSLFYKFGSESAMIEHRDNFVDMYQRIADEAAEDKAKEKAFVHDLKIGDILFSSWGWEQTNIDFYQVIALHGKKSISIQEIADNCDYDAHSMTGTKTPRPGCFVGDEIKKGVFNLYGVKLESYSKAKKWHGEPCRYSDYA